MYGSSFRMETRRPRALRMRPMLAAVMPLPREEVTPPVTKTYFAMGRVLRGFSNATRSAMPRRIGEMRRTPEVRDIRLLEAAVARARASVFGEEAYPDL